NGNNGKVIQDGDLDVSGGGHGIDITGDSATVDNKGTMTVTDPESIGIQIDGDKAVVNNEARAPSPTAAPARRLTVTTPQQTTTAKPSLTARIPPVRKSTVITGR
ncbi:hypothetical protein IXY04_14310, partial [Escherichia coli]